MDSIEIWFWVVSIGLGSFMGIGLYRIWFEKYPSIKDLKKYVFRERN